MQSWKLFLFLLISTTIRLADGLDNGLVRTPPMGWLSWVALGCQTDCQAHPLKCLSQDQLTAMADKMVSAGYRQAGYEYLIIDDCWLATERDAQGKLQPDAKRFSKGIKWLADYVHSKQLKFGIYEDYGSKTCAGYPGSQGHEKDDAQTFASWDVDYVKLDGCNVNASDLDRGYPMFGRELNATGRSIVYSCEWPLYTQMYEHKMPNYTQVRETCNVWRNWNDIGASWSSLLSIIDYFEQNQDELIKANGPGGWNDPDELIIGDPGISVDQARVQMALWCMWSAPLLISSDIRFIAQEYVDVLLNPGLISLNQDPMGIMARLVIKTPNVSVYIKPILPRDNSTGDYSYAIAFFNRDSRRKADITVRRLEQLGLRREKGYAIENLFQNELIIAGPKDSFRTTVNSTGIAVFKAVIIA